MKKILYALYIKLKKYRKEIYAFKTFMKLLVSVLA